jgi:hypothetical protein
MTIAFFGTGLLGSGFVLARAHRDAGDFAAAVETMRMFVAARLEDLPGNSPANPEPSRDVTN